MKLAAAFYLLTATVYGLSNSSSVSVWRAGQFRNLITFGDSYTDESRLDYFLSHGGTAPPTGTLLPESFATADGGRIWARYVVQYTSQTSQLYDYAVAGAVCSNKVTPKYLTEGNFKFEFPDVVGYEVPAFLADKAKDVNMATGKPYFTPALTQSNAVYAIWIGTNDIGAHAFIDDQEIPGTSITDYLDCVYDSLHKLYASGARYFVIMNMAPLYLNAEYANSSFGGVGPNQFWQDKPISNLTATSEKMRQYVDLVNSAYRYRTPFAAHVGDRFPGAHFALYDVNKLFLDIHANPTAFLNGTQPFHVNGYSHHCNVNGTNCLLAPNPDSYLWYDELHPSEQTERMVAKYFVDLLNGDGRYATYYSSKVHS